MKCDSNRLRMGCELDSQAAVDIQGTVWVRQGDQWRYFVDGGLSFDGHYMPPEQYAPYIELDSAAQQQLGLRR